jgi:hypothetical protein
MNANHYERYTPEQLLAILDLLETLRNTISDVYLLQRARDQLDLFAGFDDDGRPDVDELFF